MTLVQTRSNGVLARSPFKTARHSRGRKLCSSNLSPAKIRGYVLLVDAANKQERPRSKGSAAKLQKQFTRVRATGVKALEATGWLCRGAGERDRTIARNLRAPR